MSGLKPGHAGGRHKRAALSFPAGRRQYIRSVQRLPGRCRCRRWVCLRARCLRARGSVGLGYGLVAQLVRAHA